MLDNVELIMYMKFQKILMTRCRDMDKKHQKCPICDPQRFFFKNQTLSLLYPYGAITSYKRLEKTNKQTLRYPKTDTYKHTQTHRQGLLLKTPSGKRGVQNSTWASQSKRCKKLLLGQLIHLDIV